MKSLLSIIPIFFLFQLVFGQEVELVVDFNSGTEDSFSNWYYSSINLNDDIVVPVLSTEFGLEPAIVSNGEFKILKDINPGIEDSEPKGFMVYKEMLYFTADDGVNGFAIWRTDGTEEGTEMFFDPGDDPYSAPQGFIIAKNGWLYYSYDNVVFRTDGLVNEELYAGASLGFIYADASKNYCNYKNGIAIVDKNGDYSFSIIHIDEAEAVELARTEKTGYFAEGFGLATVSNGLMFSIYDSDIDAIFIYDENDQSLSRLAIDGKFIPSRRTINLNENENICWIASKGYFTINGLAGEEELLFYSTNSSALQGDTIIYGKYGDYVTFMASEGFFGDNFLIHTDGTVANTTNIQEVNQYTSGMLVFDRFGFIADGVSNNFNPSIYQIDLKSGGINTVIEFEESSKQINSIRPLGVQDNYLYFISNLNADVGAELYRIEVDIVNNQEVISQEVLDFEIYQNGNVFTIKMENQKDLDISINNTVGQTIFRDRVMSNLPFSVDLLSGLYYINVKAENTFSTQLIFISR